METTQKQKLLFIGDSITDVHRNRANPDSLGSGYVSMIQQEFQRRGEAECYQVINRGISGNTMTDLVERWHKDCVSLQPDVVTILIGINDTWQNVGDDSLFGTEKTAALFKMCYTHLLASLRNQSQARIILLEPFVFPFPEDRKMWRKDLDPKIAIVRELADNFGAECIGLDRYLNEVGEEVGYEALSEDGVHPTGKGHELIAEAWMQQFEKGK
ncbi:Hypothetical protein Tpal_169 [Trichococcus palustris]|jgi:lysophospholipase L1-like esterase|uniref:SGNH hydrolase-type esterase domain-containing protein n=1 Tax=Trichococcus palustris TaxID=140314 RepID=A0A143Y6V7_9LACT|nr:SGNH/GDSL hydrolase family protein [Trichococcus palustris]CZQ81210.1 Hypothetical protein Tpal_169 [Trichococcus palustris]SFK63063.1 Lysophospholipase L1 [Trichococcus palustris]